MFNVFSTFGVDVVLQDALRSYIVRSENCVQEITSLDDLRNAVLSVKTDLKKYANNIVFGHGKVDADIMIVGEAPGSEEDLQGMPFVGQSGQLLTKALSSIGLQRDDLYITNILPWRPALNRTPTSSEIALFMPYLKKHIELISPKIIICLGAISAKAILDSGEGIMKIRGRWFDYDNGIKILPTFHPAFLLRSPSQKRFFWHDLVKLKIMYENIKTL